MKRTLSVLAGSAALALALTACSNGSNDGAASKSDSGLDIVKVGLFPSSAVGAFQIGIDQGFFAEQGIEIELVMGQSSAAQLPAVNSGSLDFILASPTTPLVASSKGLDVPIVSGYAKNRPGTLGDSVAVLVGSGSDIKSAKDLEGKRVAINALGSIGEIGIKEAVAKDGGDPESITFVQLGFDQVAAQLESGQIDAGMAGPPFIGQILNNGGAVVSDFIPAAGLDGAELVMVAGRKLIDTKPDLVERFTEALDETLTYAEAHQDDVRALLPKVIGTAPEVAAKTEFIQWDAKLDADAIDQFSTLLVKYNVMNKEPGENVVWNH
ncbi:ABC transporter substrate-binding protein [Rhodococcus sp. NPDC003382]|uniref:ABC transporter substrate-binding protein n=1 Tax=unclassified Rhodococcus (in: high G+C Gram-positive bacteria) TaxID=192944 RepID=UPI0018CFB97C|nr:MULTISPECIES: ABC transporter substrate-binding protein [unclassified Rhodococcus (in: high G+C Gram-positive bacteria)]MBH0121420.1 ABC transporter substrate-binding protein [Rhodococcus sp. CX]MCK8670726.1 ABC transporter substrate-binding protein [Rhodococcus sp. HM1]